MAISYKNAAGGGCYDGPTETGALMDTTILLSMASFALAASISPGPVNVIALASGSQHGFRRSFAYVSGATVGFTALLVVIGYGLNDAVGRLPALLPVVTWAGIAFLLHMAFKLAFDRGDIDASGGEGAPSFHHGALLQWLNPKAWLASMAGMGAFAATGAPERVWVFTGLYFAICYVSIALWAVAGMLLRERIGNPARVRLLNRTLAVLLVLSAGYLAWERV